MTKYQRVEEWVLQGLESGKLQSGNMLPSESELCELLSVGRNSVRTALSNLSHNGIVETRKGIGTFCLGPRHSATMTIAFVTLYSQEYIFPRIVQGCNQVLSKNNYHLVLGESLRDTEIEREVLTKLWKRGVDGIILQPAYNGSELVNIDLLREIQLSGIPIVLVDNYYPGQQFSAVIMDDRAGGRLAASHLWSRGHRRIGVVYHRTYYPKILRMQGVIDYLHEMGQSPSKNWIIGFDGKRNLDEIHDKISETFAREAKRTRDFPTAFVCTNDQEAVELIRVAHDYGHRLAQDLSIVSFDNSTLADLPTLSLTSIDHPSLYMGATATNILLEKLKHRGIQTSTVTMIDPELVERKSVADLRARVTST